MKGKSRCVFEGKDYDSFGLTLVGRNWSFGSEYRYGFNGKESDSETYGEGNIYDYGFRIYNPRLGKFLSVDPLTRSYPWNSTYSFAENRVIDGLDLDGLEYVSEKICHVNIYAGVVKINLENLGDCLSSAIIKDNQLHKLGDNYNPILATFDVSMTDATSLTLAPITEVKHQLTETTSTPSGKVNSVKNTKSKPFTVNIGIANSNSKANGYATLAIILTDVMSKIITNYANLKINEDWEVVNLHQGYAESALNDVTRAINLQVSGGKTYIPENMLNGAQSIDHISNISSVVLKGVVGFVNETTAKDAGYISIADYENAVKASAILILEDISKLTPFIETTNTVTYSTGYTGISSSGTGLDGFTGNEVPIINISDSIIDEK